MEESDSRRLKALEAENARPKKMLAEPMLDVATLKKMSRKISDAWFAAARRGPSHEGGGLLTRV